MAAQRVEPSRESVLASEVFPGERGERESVVPLAAARLEGFVASGRGGSAWRAWCRLSHVA